MRQRRGTDIPDQSFRENAKHKLPGPNVDYFDKVKSDQFHDLWKSRTSTHINPSPSASCNGHNGIHNQHGLAPCVPTPTRRPGPCHRHLRFTLAGQGPQQGAGALQLFCRTVFQHRDLRGPSWRGLKVPLDHRSGESFARLLSGLVTGKQNITSGWIIVMLIHADMEYLP